MGAHAERDPRGPGRHRRRLALALSLLASAGCAARAQPALSYRVSVAREAPLALDVALEIRGARPSVLHTEEALGLEDAAASVPVAGPSDLAAGRAWAGCAADPCVHRYRYELGRAAERSDDAYDVASRIAGGVVAPLSSVLVYPVGLPPDAPVSIRFDVGGGARVVTSLAPGPGPQALARELPYLGYFAVGRLGSFEVRRGRAVVEVVHGLADPAPFRRLVEHRLGLLERLYGRVPAPRLSIFALEGGGAEPIGFGRMMGTAGATILLALGKEPATFAGDWVLLHELIHVGTPSLPPEGRFFDEGLATYLEPMLRVGAGELSEERGWAELARGLPFGARRAASDPIDGGAWGRTYWGGAHFALQLDLRTRERTGGAKGLAELLRATVDEGLDARTWMGLEAFLGRLDRAAGAPVATELLARFRATCEPASLPAELLGLARSRCDDDREAIRRTLARLGVADDGALSSEGAAPRRALALRP